MSYACKPPCVEPGAPCRICGESIDYCDSGLSPAGSQSILDEAASLVNGDRQAAYGHPSDNHACTAALWTAYFARCGLLRDGAELNARQVCIANILQKASRDANAPSRDNLVDIAGYASNAETADE